MVLAEVLVVVVDGQAVREVLVLQTKALLEETVVQFRVATLLVVVVEQVRLVEMVHQAAMEELAVLVLHHPSQVLL
jgi:hypothetical protein